MDYYLPAGKIDEYTHFLRQEERSQVTIKKYIHDIRHFYRYQGNDDMINKEKVMEYKYYLSERYKSSSANSMIAALNGYFTWAGASELRVKSFKTQKRIFTDKSRELSRQEYEKLLNTAREQGKDRLRMIMQTIGATGIRISELSCITVEAVRRGEAVVKGKSKLRVILITAKLRRYLINYCHDNNINKGPVFVTRNGSAVDRSNIWSEMKQLCQAAGISEAKVFPHNLRHLFARICYKMKKDIVYLADILGHSNIETTRIYTISSGGEHKKMLASLGLVV